MLIAIPKEILPEEKRVAATPETVKKYVALGFAVNVEQGAGAGIRISDDDYKKAGANITADVEALYAAADIVLKVKQPVYNEQRRKHEVEMLPSGAILVTFLHPAAPGNHAMVRSLRAKNITALTMMDSSEHGVLRLVVDDVAKARQVLAKVNIPTTETQVLCVDMPNKPGAMSDVCRMLGDAHINISYAYCTTEAPMENSSISVE